MHKFFYDVQVWFARHFLSKTFAGASISVDVGIGRCVEVALCGRTPYYDDLKRHLTLAKDYWGLSDKALKSFEIRFVPEWFDIVTTFDPWSEMACVGAVVMHMREIKIAFHGATDEEEAWDRTLVHEFAHIYCHEHPELGVAWDPEHKATEVWKKVNDYSSKI